MDKLSNSDAQSKVWEMIKDIRVTLLVTRDQDGKMHARPMVAANKDFLANYGFLPTQTRQKFRRSNMTRKFC